MSNMEMQQTILAALIMVMLIATVFFAFANNTADEDEQWISPEGRFTYRVQVELEGMVYNGTEVVNTMGSSIWTWENETFAEMLEEARDEPNSFVFLHVISIGIYQILMDKVQMDTPWGVKKLDRGITLWPDLEGGFLMRVSYGGGETLLTYRHDIIAKNWRATFLLTGTDYQGLENKDREWSDRQRYIGTSDEYYGDVWTLRGDSELRLMSADDKEYEVSVKNYAYYHFSQEVMMSMFEGGTLRYDEERSVIGNGSVRFKLEGDWYLRIIMPEGDQPNLFMMDSRG